MKKIFVSIIALLVFALPSTNTFAFMDTTSATQSAVVSQLSMDNIVSGYSDGTFRPNQKITRGQVAAIITRSTTLTPVRPTKDFLDVPKSHAFYSSIQQLYRANIVNGHGGKFYPNQPITRGELSKMLVASLKLDLANTTKFKDVPKNHMFNVYIGALVKSGITFGYQDGTFKPNQHVTRGEFASFMYRSLYGKEPTVNKSTITSFERYAPTLLKSITFNVNADGINKVNFPFKQTLNKSGNTYVPPKIGNLISFTYEGKYFSYGVDSSDYILGRILTPLKLNGTTTFTVNEGLGESDDVTYNATLHYVNNIKTKMGTFQNVTRITTKSSKNTNIFYFKEGFGLIKHSYYNKSTNYKEKTLFEVTGFEFK